MAQKRKRRKQLEDNKKKLERERMLNLQAQEVLTNQRRDKVEKDKIKIEK